MVTVRTVKLRNSLYYKESSNILRIDAYTKGIPDIVNSKWYSKEWLRIWFHLSYLDFLDEDLLLHRENSCRIQMPIFLLLCHSFVAYNLPLVDTVMKIIAQ